MVGLITSLLVATTSCWLRQHPLICCMQKSCAAEWAQVAGYVTLEAGATGSFGSRYTDILVLSWHCWCDATLCKAEAEAS